MCRFVRSPEPEPDQVSLEVKAAGGKLMAVLKPPATAAMLCFNDVPLLRAVKMAKLMADYLDTDVVIVDRLGIWHEWLVDWACTPVGAGDGDALPPHPIAAASPRPAAEPGLSRALHAPPVD